MKDLGDDFDAILNVEKHIKDITSSAYKYLAFILRCFKGFTFSMVY